MGNPSQISNLQTELKYLDKLKCYRILSDSGGPPPWGDGRWVDGGGGRHGCGGCPMHTCMHTHMYACMHTCTCMLNMLNMDASMLAAICNSIHVCVCVCMHAHACVCIWGHPPFPQIPPDTHPPTCPLPRAAGSPKHQISITLELIEIIRFCLKILYLRTFLNSYRL